MPKSDTSDKPRLVYLLSIAARRVQLVLAGFGFGHSVARAGVLFALTKDRATPAAKVQKTLDLEAPAFSGLVDRMVKDRWIERKPDPEDGRAWLLRLTDLGVTHREKASRFAKMVNESLSDGFTAAELAVVERWLLAVQKNFPKGKVDD